MPGQIFDHLVFEGIKGAREDMYVSPTSTDFGVFRDEAFFTDIPYYPLFFFGLQHIMHILKSGPSRVWCKCVLDDACVQIFIRKDALVVYMEGLYIRQI